MDLLVRILVLMQRPQKLLDLVREVGLLYQVLC